MYKVCDSTLSILSEWSYLGAAKESARIRSIEYGDQTFFVCNAQGMVVAGFTNGH
jgi:hypothetical protein